MELMVRALMYGLMAKKKLLMGRILATGSTLVMVVVLVMVLVMVLGIALFCW